MFELCVQIQVVRCRQKWQDAKAKLRERFDLKKAASSLDDVSLRRAKSLLAGILGKGAGKGGGRNQDEGNRYQGTMRDAKVLTCWKCGLTGHTRDQCNKRRRA